LTRERNDNKAGGKVHDNYHNDHLHVNVQLVVSDQMLGIPQSRWVCIH